MVLNNSMAKKTLIVAEVKTKSPFGWKSSDTWKNLFRIADEIGDIISIHTDPRWGGSLKLIERARGLTKKPILAKGIHRTDEDVKEATAAGADYVLVVGRIPLVHMNKCWIEPLVLEELNKIPLRFKVVWNTRDQYSGGKKHQTFSEARKLWKGRICQASHIRNIDDIQKGADAALVGTHLVEFAESLKHDPKATASKLTKS